MSLTKRKVDLEFTGDIPKHWANDDPFLSHWLNAYTLLIPDGERFIIRSCKKYSNNISLDLADEIRGLYYQEGQHSVQHKKALDVFQQQGYRVNWFKVWSSFICYRILEPIFPNVSALSTASAIEHINAVVAEHFLSSDNFFETSSKQMGQMFAWHFAEEIEHKSVVFDVLNQVNKNYLLRLFGLITTFFTFVAFLYLAAFVFAFQDRSIFRMEFWRGFYRFNIKEKFLGKLLHASGLYMKSKFHPVDVDNEHLVDRGITIFQTLRG